jgi:topoisomerase IA-like protein
MSGYRARWLNALYIALGTKDSQILLTELYSNLSERSSAIVDDMDQVRVTELAFDDLDSSIRVMLGRYGVYLVSDKHEKNRNVPETIGPADLTSELANELLDAANGEAFEISSTNASGDSIWVKFVLIHV